MQGINNISTIKRELKFRLSINSRPAKVKQFLYAAGQALRVPESWGARISKRHIKVVRLSPLRTGCL